VEFVLLTLMLGVSTASVDIPNPFKTARHGFAMHLDGLETAEAAKISPVRRSIVTRPEILDVTFRSVEKPRSSPANPPPNSLNGENERTYMS
jgi:hypothetical protein